MRVLPYDESCESDWDALCADAINATFLHTRRFLGYHGPRFKDVSVLIENGGRLVGAFPAAAGEPGTVTSHPGATYGGIVHDGRIAGMRMVDAIAALRAYYGSRGYSTLQYKAIPAIYARVPAQDDLYALFRHGASRYRCDLSCAIDLACRRRPSERRRRGLRRAGAAFTAESDLGHLAALWDVVTANLASRHEARPVHSLDEIALLAELFPENVRILCALADGRVEAGVVFFNSPRVWHAQYIAASPTGQELSALDLVFDAAIGLASAAGARYLDFGTSNTDGGTVLNDGLYRFKHEFGGGGIVHEFYQLSL